MTLYMRTRLLIIFVITCALFTSCEGSKPDSRPTGSHLRSRVRKIPDVIEKVSRRRNKNKYKIKHHLPDEALKTPIVQSFSDMFRSTSMDERRTQCKEIPLQFALCYDIGYPRMHLPNLIGHDSIDELVKQSNEWTPLLSTRCHAEARKFLCSVFAPVCVEDFSRPIPPCQSLCEAVRDGCSPAMARFDYPWPYMLNCSQFPTEEALCIPSETREFTTTPPATTICSPCRRKKISKSFKKKLCSFDFIMKVRVKSVSYHKGSTKLILEKKSRAVFKWLDDVNQQNTKRAKRIMAKKTIIWMRDGLNCSCDVLQEGVHTNYLIAGWQEKGKLRLYSITKWRKSDKRLSKLLKRKNCKSKSS